MKVIVHIRQAVEIEVPSALIKNNRSRWDTSMQKYAVDAALDVLQQGVGKEVMSKYGNRPYFHHPALGWIEYPKKEMTSGAI